MRPVIPPSRSSVSPRDRAPARGGMGPPGERCFPVLSWCRQRRPCRGRRGITAPGAGRVGSTEPRALPPAALRSPGARFGFVSRKDRAAAAPGTGPARAGHRDSAERRERPPSATGDAGKNRPPPQLGAGS